ncbi:MAG: endonuclease III [Clostridia bacterium]|nr:endonuclease III [Clostridia bacterium]
MRKQKIDEILNFLNTQFPEAKCELEYNTPYQLLVAVILSAQCTDKRVNMVTEKLFKIAPTPQKMLELGENKLKQIIHSCGFYNNKAKSIISATQSIVNDYNGKVPCNMEQLSSLAGVGRKTANVVLAEGFNQPAIAVDTHVHRVSKRLGLSSEKSTPEKCEQALLKLIPSDKQAKFHIQMVWFGRYFCKALKPECENCKLKSICKRK